VSSQEFADKSFYLVDSLVIDKLQAADRRVIDSALREYHATTVDTIRMRAVTRIIDSSWDDEVWPKYNQWQYEYIQKCLKKDLPEKTRIRLMKYLSNCLNNFGVICNNRGEDDKALAFFLKSLEVDKEIGGDSRIATSLSNIGYVYSVRGDIPRALDYYHQALKIQEKSNDKTGESRSLNNIGFIYQDLGDNEKAIDYYNQSLTIRRETGDKMGIAVSLSNIAETYEEDGNISKSLKYYKESLNIYNELGNSKGTAGALNNIGYLYQQYGDPDCNQAETNCRNEGQLKALEYCSKALKIQRQSEDNPGMAATLNNIGRIYIVLNKFAIAKSYATEAYQISKQLGYPDHIRKSASLMRIINYHDGDFKAAYQFFIEETTMRDSIESENNYREVQKKQAKYFYNKIYESDSIAFAAEKAKDAIEIEKQRSELDAKRMQQIFLYSGLSLFILLAVFLWTRVKKINIQKKTIEEQKLLVEEKNREVMDSINYAKRIQDAILPSMDAMNKTLKDGFVLYRPKDIVAGDFYWMVEKQGFVYVAAADCTGHGVPGAMVSVVCSNALNRSVNEYGINHPGEILDKVQELVLETFAQNQNNVKDGMDISLVALSHVGTDGYLSLQWAGANNPLWIVRDATNEVVEIKADKQPIGNFAHSHPFTTHSIELKRNDRIYLFTDGYDDQFGGPKGKKYMIKSLKELISNIAHLPMHLQERKLAEAFDYWKGTNEQVDDVCIIGVRV
jgi:tetratricopeptide (TPR) repeat protein